LQVWGAYGHIFYAKEEKKEKKERNQQQSLDYRQAKTPQEHLKTPSPGLNHRSWKRGVARRNDKRNYQVA